MEEVGISLNVLFEEPFWVGVFSRIYNGKLSVCKVTFGAEPKDYDVYAFVLNHYSQLCFSPALPTAIRQGRLNPKRMQREVHRQIQTSGVGTKAQQALQAQHEQNKLQRVQRSREHKELEKQRQFALKQQKRKEKHRGR